MGGEDFRPARGRIAGTRGSVSYTHLPEKLIPVVILKALAGEPIPVYGKGENVRDWLYVLDLSLIHI